MLRIGIIGAGFMGRQHAASVVGIAEIRLAGVADEDGERAAELAGQHGARSWSSASDMISSGEVDAVIVATPTDTHAPLAIEALDAGIHAFVEKPVARTVEQAAAMVEAARRSGCVLAVGHVIRYYPEYRAIGRMIESGELGEVAVATFGRRCQKPNWAPDGWHTSMERSGGVVLDMMIHDVDLVRWYFGEPNLVHARCLGSDRHSGLDYALATLTVPGGPICHLHGSWCEPDGFSQVAEVCGSRGMVTYDSRGRDELLFATHGAPGAEATALPPPPADERDPFQQQQRDWIGQIAGRGTLVNDADWAIASLRVALAMLESEAAGQPVEVATPAEAMEVTR